MELEELKGINKKENNEIRKIKRDASKLIQNKSVMSDPFWLDQPSILFQSDRLNQFFPNHHMTFIEKLNSISRLAIYLGVSLYIVSSNYNWLYLAILVPIFTVFMYKSQKDNIETYFNNYDSLDNEINKMELLTENYTKATVNNPFSNINLITDHRNKAPAEPSWNNSDVMNDINDKFNYNLYKDAGDLYGKNNSQRQFYTAPCSTIPNDQTMFSKWLYQVGPTCKEKSIYCSPETPAYPYLDTSNASEYNNIKY